MHRLSTAARLVSADGAAGGATASPYVADAVAPMRAFAQRDGADPAAWPAPLRSWCGQVGRALHASFAAAATEAVDGARKQEVALRRLKRKQGKRLSESERLCRQVRVTLPPAYRCRCRCRSLLLLCGVQLRADMGALNAALAGLGVHVDEWPQQKQLEATLGQ